MLDNEVLLYYVRKARQGDEEAKQIVFNNNEPLIKSIIRRFKNKGVEYDDLYQIACLGFLKAIKNFDESFGVKFSTYTVPMVVGEIKRYIRDNGAVKVSRTLKILANKINRFIDEYQTQNNQPPTIEFLSEKFNVTQDEIVVAMDSARMPVSIFDKVDEDDGQELIEKIPYVDNEDALLSKIQLTNVFEKLSEREKKIIILRYFRDKTQSETAECVGVSQVQVSRLENKIIEKMRQNF